VAEPPKDGGKAADAKKPPGQDQAMQMLEMVLKGFRAYQDSRRSGKDDKKPLNQDLAKLLWEYMSKSYRPPEGKGAKTPDKQLVDLQAEAFLQAF
jgi:hypothetical protein